MCPARHLLLDCIVSAVHVHPDVGMALGAVKFGLSHWNCTGLAWPLRTDEAKSSTLHLPEVKRSETRGRKDCKGYRRAFRSREYGSQFRSKLWH